MNNSSLFAERIKQERKRLGYTQQEIAEKCGVSREMWGKYERGLAIANCELLFSLLSLGADIQFIISGSRKESLNVWEDKIISLLKQYDITSLEVIHNFLAHWKPNSL